MLDDEFIETPDEPEVEAQELPLTVIEPELVVTLAPFTKTPLAPEVPLVAIPVIVTLPALVAVILADPSRETPWQFPPVAKDVPLKLIEPELVLTRLLSTEIPLTLVVPFAIVPVIVTLPDPLEEISADDCMRTAVQPDVPLAIVPMIVTLPAPVELIWADDSMRTPVVPDVPLAIVPVIVTLPAPVEEISADDCIQTPDELWSEAHEVPLIVIEPELVVTLTPFAKTPFALIVPFPLTPVIVTHPDPPACTFDNTRFNPAQAVLSPPRPLIVILPPVVFTFTVEPVMHTPWNVPA